MCVLQRPLMVTVWLCQTKTSVGFLLGFVICTYSPRTECFSMSSNRIEADTAFFLGLTWRKPRLSGHLRNSETTPVVRERVPWRIGEGRG